MPTTNPAGSPVIKVYSPTPAPTGSEFERFTDLASKLVQVPKNETGEKPQTA